MAKSNGSEDCASSSSRRSSLAAPASAQTRGDDRRGLLRLRDAGRSALLARRLDHRLRRHDGRSETEPAAQHDLVGAGRRLARADGADDGAAVVEQPALEPGRQGDRLPVGAADAGRRGHRHAAHAGLAAAARRRRAAASSPACSTAPRRFSGRPTAAGWSSSDAAARATPRSRRATCATTRTSTTSSTTPAGSTTSGRTSG